MGLLDALFPSKLEKGLVPKLEVVERPGGGLTVRTPPAPVERQVYSPNSPTPLGRVASRFMAELLPASATREEHEYWFVHWRTAALANVTLLREMSGESSSDWTILSDVKQLSDDVVAKSSYWDQLVGTAVFPVNLALRASVRQLRSLAIYAFEVADAGFGAHIGETPDRLIADGTISAEKLERDYVNRLALYQAIFHLLTDEDTRFLLTGEEPSLSGNRRALGLTGAEIAAVIAVAAAVIVIAFIVYSYMQIVSVNRFFDKQAQECHKLFASTGEESELCKRLADGYSKSVTETPANKLADDFTTYLFAAGGVVLGIMFLPEITASIREARRGARADRQMASNRRRRRR